MTQKIYVSDGSVSIIDDDDFDFLRGFNWHRIKNSKGKHGCVCFIGREQHCMHRMILGLGKEQKSIVVRHRNENKLDNRRSNLKVTTKSLVAAAMIPRSTTGFKGVHYDRRRNSYWASIFVDGEFIFLGRYESAKDAALAYNEAAAYKFGCEAVINKF